MQGQQLNQKRTEGVNEPTAQCDPTTELLFKNYYLQQFEATVQCILFRGRAVMILVGSVRGILPLEGFVLSSG